MLRKCKQLFTEADIDVCRGWAEGGAVGDVKVEVKDKMKADDWLWWRLKILKPEELRLLVRHV